LRGDNSICWQSDGHFDFGRILQLGIHGHGPGTADVKAGQHRGEIAELEREIRCRRADLMS
jgi:hypothetical protein